MFKLDKVFYKNNQRNILNNLNFEIPSNKTVVIMGKNGSGKSTLLKLLNKIILPSSGELHSSLEKPVPMLFQKPIEFENTVEYNFLILQKIKKHRLDRKWFNTFNLERIKNQNINTLSGGEKQKLFLSRIMSLNQNILFLDEPNQSLDLESEKLFVDLLSKEKHNKTILLTLHDFEIAKKIADLIIYLDRGKIYMYEETHQFFNKFHV